MLMLGRRESCCMAKNGASQAVQLKSRVDMVVGVVGRVKFHHHPRYHDEEEDGIKKKSINKKSSYDLMVAVVKAEAEEEEEGVLITVIQAHILSTR
ncbi:hypothetical protein Tco_1488755 [Tanacetum coccineum]